MEQKTLYDIAKYVAEYRLPFDMHIDWLTPAIEIRIQDSACGGFVVRYPQDLSCMMLQNPALLYEAVVGLAEFRKYESTRYRHMLVKEEKNDD